MSRSDNQLVVNIAKYGEDIEIEGPSQDHSAVRVCVVIEIHGCEWRRHCSFRLFSTIPNPLLVVNMAKYGEAIEIEGGITRLFAYEWWCKSTVGNGEDIEVLDYFLTIPNSLGGRIR